MTILCPSSPLHYMYATFKTKFFLQTYDSPEAHTTQVNLDNTTTKEDIARFELHIHNLFKVAGRLGLSI